MIINTNQPRTLRSSGISVLPTPLRRFDPLSPWCYSATVSPSSSLPPGTNFLATQVWPSSRTASFVLEQHLDPSWTVCELGCGPGLPSLTAAKLGAARVIASDVDEVALEMVKMAALEQGFCREGLRDGQGEERLFTQKFDLTAKEERLPRADLYILSDVFESSIVAEGAAWHVKSLFGKSNNQRDREIKSESNDNTLDDESTTTSRVWVFAQSDRAQRDLFLKSLRELSGCQDLDWTANHNPEENSRIWLFDLNETGVQYN